MSEVSLFWGHLLHFIGLSYLIQVISRVLFVIEQALAETPVAESLTDRVREILPLLAAGLTSPQIADRMCLSLPTIKWYRKRLLEKFDVSNTAELISKAKEQGVL